MKWKIQNGSYTDLLNPKFCGIIHL